MEIGCHLPMFGPMATRETVLAFARRMGPSATTRCGRAITLSSRRDRLPLPVQ